jgi:hypothetical protein
MGGGRRHHPHTRARTHTHLAPEGGPSPALAPTSVNPSSPWGRDPEDRSRDSCSSSGACHPVVPTTRMEDESTGLGRMRRRSWPSLSPSEPLPACTCTTRGSQMGTSREQGQHTTATRCHQTRQTTSYTPLLQKAPRIVVSAVRQTVRVSPSHPVILFGSWGQLHGPCTRESEGRSPRM